MAILVPNEWTMLTEVTVMEFIVTTFIAERMLMVMLVWLTTIMVTVMAMNRLLQLHWPFQFKNSDGKLAAIGLI